MSMTQDAGDQSVVIIGGGQAGHQLAMSLREEGFDGPVRIICEERFLPYQRPPLSKRLGEDDLAFASAAEYERQGIQLVLGRRAIAIERDSKRVVLDGGASLAYGQLVIATGARNRTLPGALDNDRVIFLRGLDDARNLRGHLESSAKLLVVGAGFLGLEAAAMAASLGLEVDVIEAGIPMGRGVTPQTAGWFVDLHQRNGIRIHAGSPVEAISQDSNGVHLRLANGREFSAPVVLVSIGVIPNTEIASQAGLAVVNGIVVDEALWTSDPAIAAIGDCASFPDPHSGLSTRLESVQNAVDQARYLAAFIALSSVGPYRALPWFWSEQGKARLQIAGMPSGADEVVTRGDVAGQKFSNFCFRQGKLVAVESINSPADHMSARKCLSSRHGPSRSMLDRGDFDFRAWVKDAL